MNSQSSSSVVQPSMDTELVAAVGKRFIQRRDVKAQQTQGGSYFPVTSDNGKRVPWRRADFDAHFSGKRSHGHYLLDQDSQCKLFAFDFDLEKTGFYIPVSSSSDDSFDLDSFWHTGIEFNPRADWRNRAHPSRPWVKYQMHMLAHVFVKTIEDLLKIPACAAYTGNKGIHVYGFTGTVSAATAREGAQIVLDYLDCWELSRGKSFWTCKDDNTYTGYRNFSLEVFPKQDTLDGKDLGNLLRLPLGVNQKSPQDPTFFIDLRTAHTEFRAHPDPVRLLEFADNWT